MAKKQIKKDAVKGVKVDNKIIEEKVMSTEEAVVAVEKVEPIKTVSAPAPKPAQKVVVAEPAPAPAQPSLTSAEIYNRIKNAENTAAIIRMRRLGRR